MPTLQEVHQQSYADMPFDQFATKYREKYYPDMPMDQFMAKAGGAPAKPDAPVETDPYRATARREVDDLRAKGVPVNNGAARQFLQGATFNLADEVLAGLSTPLEMIKRGTFSPVEGYNHAKAREDILLEDARKNGGILGQGAEIAGGLVTGGNLAKAGATFMPSQAGAGFLRNTAGFVGDGAVYGGIMGAADANGANRLAEGAKGAAIGGALGGAIPVVGRVAGMAAAPVINPIMARINPEGQASAKILEAFQRSKMSPEDVARSLTDAAGDGQRAFTVADALGNSGQRMLSAVARIPQGERQALVEALDRRQGDQGRRLAAFLREGFDAPQTAQQTEQVLSAARSARAEVNYGPVKTDPTSIDVTDAVAAANRSISPLADQLAQGRVATDLAARRGVEAGEAAIRDPIREAVKEARSYLASPTLTINNVEKAFRAKTNIDMMIAKATEMGQGAKVAELMPVRDALDNALARTSKEYAAARNAYKADSQVVDAVGLGKKAGVGGLAEDNIQTFANLGNEAERSAFRAGYADPMIGNMQNSGFGVDKSRTLITDATGAEFPRFAAPGRADQMQRRIGREQTMFETRRAATGGSKTADNLADSADIKSFDPSVIAALIRQDYVGAAKNLAARAGSEANGMTPGVAEQLSRALMETSPQQVKTMADKALENVKLSEGKKQIMVRALLGTGVNTSNNQRK